MHFELIVKNTEPTERMKKLVEQKLGSDLEKHLVPITEDLKTATVTIEKDTRWGYTVSAKLVLPGDQHLFAQNKHEKVITAVTGVRDKLERQIKRYKSTS